MFSDLENLTFYQHNSFISRILSAASGKDKQFVHSNQPPTISMCEFSTSDVL